MFRATAPPANDAPPDVVAGEGAASDGVASFDDSEEEQANTVRPQMIGPQTVVRCSSEARA